MGKLLTVEEMAARMQVKPTTIRFWARAGVIPALRITPKIVRFDPEAVLAAINERQEPVK